MANESCKLRVKLACKARLKELKYCWKAYTEDKTIKRDGEEYTPDSFHEYGLGFDYVAPGTFGDQKIGYFRYQISWGGPSDEFRFFTSGPRFKIYKIEFWFLDWFDGAKVTIKSGANFEFLSEIFEWFREVGSVENEYQKSMEDD